MTRMTGPDCAVMCNLINTHTHHKERTQDKMGTGTGAGTETKAVGDGDGDKIGNGDRDEDGIGEGGRETKNRKKPHKSFRRDVGNGGDLGGGGAGGLDKKGSFISCRPR